MKLNGAGKVFAAVMGRVPCCLCGHEHESNLVVTFEDEVIDGVPHRIKPYWCGFKLGIHRADFQRVVTNA